MSLSRKHFVAIADDINRLMNADMRFQDCRDEAFSEFVEGLCYYFGQENHRFDRDKFIKACGFENGLYSEVDYD
tara:strand:- start:71 stop:292 length:222 start_codon:yes stop_codon:yes gene_type:complete